MAKKLSKEDFCYELQSGLVVSLDENDSDAVIDDDSNGRFAFSQDGCNYEVTFSDIKIKDGAKLMIRFWNYGSEKKSVVIRLENVVVTAPEVVVTVSDGDNAVVDTCFYGDDQSAVVICDGVIADSVICNSLLDLSTAKQSEIRNSRLESSTVENSLVTNSYLRFTNVATNSLVELSSLCCDDVTAAIVGGVSFGRDGLGITEWRTFNDGYFVGRDHHGCFEEVPDKLVYTEALVSYILDRRLKMNLDVRCSSYALFCHYDDFHSDLDNYCPSDLFRRDVKKRWVLVPDCFKDDLKKDVPFIDMILTDNA